MRGLIRRIGRHGRFRLGQMKEASIVARATCLIKQHDARHQEIRIEGVERLCNPTILRTPDRAEGPWTVMVRSPNYRMLADGAYIVPGGIERLSSDNWLLGYDEDLGVRSAVRLDDDEAKAASPDARNGFEDPRLFFWKDMVYGLWSACRLGPDQVAPDARGASKPNWKGSSNVMAIAPVDDGAIGRALSLPSPHGCAREKNWMPAVEEDRLALLYRLDRMEVYQMTDDALQLIHQTDQPIRPLVGWSGSSQLIPWEDGWLCVAHLACRQLKASFSAGPFYPHRFVRIARDWRVTGLSEPFFFEKRGLEFCSGLAAHDGRVFLSYGIDDCAAALMSLPIDSVKAMIAPLR